MATRATGYYECFAIKAIFILYTLLWTYRNICGAWTWIIFFCPGIYLHSAVSELATKSDSHFFFNLNLTLLVILRRLQNIYLIFFLSFVLFFLQNHNLEHLL